MIASPIEATAELLPRGRAVAADEDSSSTTSESSATRVHGPSSTSTANTATSSSSTSTANTATSSSSASNDEAKSVVAPNLAAEPNPFDEQVWRAEGGSDSEADVAGAYPIVGHPIRKAIVAVVGSKRNLAIVAGAAFVLIIGIVLASGGDDAKPSSDPSSVTKDKVATTNVEPAPEAPAAEPATEPATEPAIGSASDSASAAMSEGAGSAAATEPAEPAPEPARTTTRTPTARKRTAPVKKKEPTIAGKQVVIETDTQARAGKPVANAAKADQAAIARARRAYTAGNSRLFAGDAEGAIQQYRQAIAHYPAYAAGYRGLGLAYAQKGDRTNAVKALRTYVRAAPGAKDAPIIRRRIDALSTK